MYSAGVPLHFSALHTVALHDAPTTPRDVRVADVAPLVDICADDEDVAPGLPVDAVSCAESARPQFLLQTPLPQFMFPTFARGDLPLDAASFSEVIYKIVSPVRYELDAPDSSVDAAAQSKLVAGIAPLLCVDACPTLENLAEKYLYGSSVNVCDAGSTSPVADPHLEVRGFQVALSQCNIVQPLLSYLVEVLP